MRDYSHKTKKRSRPFLRGCRIVLSLFFICPGISLLVVGCVQPNVNDYPILARTTEPSLEDIEPFDIEGLEATEEMSTEDAQVAAVRRILAVEKAEARTYSLGELRQMALANNMELIATRFDPAIAQTSVTKAEGRFDAVIGARASRARQVQPEQNVQGFVLPADRDTTTNDFGPSLQVPLVTGGSIKYEPSWRSSDTENRGQPAPKEYSAYQRLTFEQPLLRGGWPTYNQAPIVLAMYETRIADARTRQAVLGLLLQVEELYWRLYGAWRTVKVQISLFKTQQQELENARALFEGGEGTLADVYGFESGLANQVVRLIEADYRLRDVIRNLKSVVQNPDMSLSSLQVIEPGSVPTLIRYEFEMPDLITEALDNRMEILEDELEIARSDLQIEVAENELLPTLNARIGVTFQGESNISYNQANRSLFDGDYDTGWNIGLEASYPLGNQIARAEYQRARLRRLKLIATKAQREITVAKEVYAAVDALASAWAKLIAAGIEVDAAERSFKAEKELFDLNDRTSTDVSVAIFRLGSSRENRINAEVEYEISLSRLAHATGSFLGYAGVQWGPANRDTDVSIDNSKQLLPPDGLLHESDVIDAEEEGTIDLLRKSMEEPQRPDLPKGGISVDPLPNEEPEPAPLDPPLSLPGSPAPEAPSEPASEPNTPATPETPKKPATPATPSSEPGTSSPS